MIPIDIGPYLADCRRLRTAAIRTALPPVACYHLTRTSAICAVLAPVARDYLTWIRES